MGDQPSYADLRKEREDSGGGKYLSAKNFPNGLDVTVVRTEVQPAWVPQGSPPSGRYSAVWVVTVPGLEGEKFVKESGFMSDKLTELEIEDPTGRKFMLAAETYKGNATFKIARAL